MRQLLFRVCDLKVGRYKQLIELMNLCEHSRSASFCPNGQNVILKDQISGERSQDHWSSGISVCNRKLYRLKKKKKKSSFSTIQTENDLGCYEIGATPQTILNAYGNAPNDRPSKFSLNGQSVTSFLKS